MAMLPAAIQDSYTEPLAAAAARGDATALARLLPPLAPWPPQAVLDAALLAAAGGEDFRTSTLVAGRADELDAAAALLIGAGAAVDALDEEGATPLHVAAAAGNVPLVRRLLAAGARADGATRHSADEYCGVMPHLFAASYGRCEAMALLLDSGGQVGVRRCADVLTTTGCM
jgi:hypothetical protein